MDYGTLLCKAQEITKNESTKEVRCYKTEFSAPKKLERSKVSSANIKKFLARRDAEEKRKREEACKKKEDLLALRSQDKKAQRRVQVMLKSTKSANKSVMEDAIDNVNTAVTLGGFKQCDEDDYGYVSSYSSAFYNNLLNKYQNTPNEPSLFSKPKKEVKDLSAAKDRVRAALQKESEEEMLPHKRKKKKLESNSVDVDETELTEPEKEPEKQVKQEKPHVKRQKLSAPPPLNFDELLQLAKKKQFEPIVIEKPKIKKEPERLMTKKEKMELEKDEKMKRISKNKNPNGANYVTRDAKDQDNKNKDYKRQEQLKVKKVTFSEKIIKSDQENKKEIKDKATISKNTLKNNDILSSERAMEKLKKDSSVWGGAKSSSQGLSHKSLEKKKNLDLNKNKMLNHTNPNKEISKKLIQKSNLDSKTMAAKSGNKLKDKDSPKDLDKQLELLRLKKEMMVEKNKLKKMELEQMKYASKAKKRPVPVKKNKAVTKRRIGSESEEDSELDDFIDDGPNDEGADYSKYISEIFGYDKSKYVDDDDECMESNWAQQMREESISTRIGIMEDLEDIQKEKEEMARKKLKRSRH